MSNGRRFFNKLSWTFLIACLFLAIPGCGALRTLQASSHKYDRKEDGTGGRNDVAVPNFAEDRYLVDTANRFALMALFAETVYRRELPEKQRDKEGCRYLDKDQVQPDYGMPRQGEAGWRRWLAPDRKAGDAPPCFDEFGLYYETYVYATTKEGPPQEAVIAFRGTENRAGQTLLDWTTSFSAAVGIEPRQYAEARTRVLSLIDQLQAANGEVKIYVTGHSLGGGLAQQAGYLSKSVKEVFTFNTSPVTNWTNLRFEGLVEQGFPIIHRIYHGGEFLELPRFIATQSTTARYGRHDIGVQFDKRNPTRGHSMKIIACNFAKLIRDAKLPGAEHQYPTSYIVTQVLDDSPKQNQGKVCSEKQDDEKNS